MSNGKLPMMVAFPFFDFLSRTSLKSRAVLNRIHMRFAPHGARLNGVEEERE